MSIPVVLLLKVRPTAEFEVANELRELCNGQVTVTFGEYDIVCQLECPSVKELTGIVGRIRNLEGVLKASTLVGVDARNLK